MKRSPHTFTLSLLCLATLLLLTIACQSDILTPPRLATTTAQSQQIVDTPEPFISQAPTPTAVFTEESVTLVPVAERPNFTIWVNETSPAHEALLQTVADGFGDAYGVDVEMQLVSPMLLPELMHTAVVSPQFPIPDIVIHSVEQTMGWAADGVLNVTLADEIVDEIGRDTFDLGALDWLVQSGQTAAIPLHGFNQIILYRTDWYTEQGLDVPDDYAAMLAGAETFFNRENLTSGFIVPTESNLVTTHLGFEHMALANGCQIFNNEGEVLLLDQACQDALDFYYEIIHNYSPPGVQTDSSARRAFLAGRTGLIMTSPSILPLLAGLEPGLLPTCTECAANISYLAENSGVLTQITGSGLQAAPSNFGNMTVMGVTREADRETAVAFAQYWFDNAYTDWLAIETERKVPMRWGTADQPRQFIDNWGIIPLSGSSQSLMDIYGDEVIGRLRDGITSSPRWGFRQGQGALMSNLFGSLTFPVVLQEMLSGYFNPNQTIFEAYVRVIEFIPNYTFEIEPTPTPES